MNTRDRIIIRCDRNGWSQRGYTNICTDQVQETVADIGTGCGNFHDMISLPIICHTIFHESRSYFMGLKTIISSLSSDLSKTVDKIKR